MTLDTLVATAGMGWQVIGFSDPVPKGGYVRLQCAYFGSDHPDRCSIFQPSTNIAHAMMALDAQPLGTYIAIERRFGNWYALLITPQAKDVHARQYSGNGKNICEALCLALLRAKDVPEEKIKEAMP